MVDCGIIAPRRTSSAHFHRPWRAISQSAEVCQRSPPRAWYSARAHRRCVSSEQGNIEWSGNLTKLAARYPHPVWSRMARVRKWRQPAPRSDLGLRDSQCSALRSTSGFCRPPCSSTRSCQRRSRPPQSSCRLPRPPNVFDASARSSGRSGVTNKAVLVLHERRRMRSGPAARPWSATC